MGSPLGGGGINATFAPKIVISGNADVEEVRAIIDQKWREFKAWVADMQNQKRRLNYG